MARAFSQKIALMHLGGPGSGPALLKSRQGAQLACPGVLPQLSVGWTWRGGGLSFLLQPHTQNPSLTPRCHLDPAPQPRV